MVQSASVEALLTLNATGFTSGMNNAIKKVDSLVGSISKAGGDINSFDAGLRKLASSMQLLNGAFEQFNVKTKDAKAFNNVANGMERIVNSARALAEGNISLQATYQHMENVVRMFANALNGVEVKMKGTVAVTREVATSTSATSSAFGRMRNELLQVANAITKEEASLTNVDRTVRKMGLSFNSSSSYITKFSNVVNTSTGKAFSSIISNINITNSNLDKLGYQFTETSTKVKNFATNYKLAMSQLGQSSFTKARDDLMKLAQGVEKFNAIKNSFAGTSTGYASYISQINEVKSALAGLEGQATKTRASMGTGISTSGGYGGYLSNINQVQAGLSKLEQQSYRTGNASKQMGQGIQSASNSSSTARQRFNGLTQTLGGLRSMLSMVGSMFLYNFAHNMMISVQNTVKAKSEMLSFLHTMGMTGSQINNFNSALDRTAERFQRINKYNIGETVANIGLEFDLSAKEMEKAMSVTSMITSEYLRAGRNADEASLAVKDILQGQFQRLSRETGVKGETLKEAGWSGDVNDVMGLMNALEKVAKARHWDVFAEKASSLNDILLITQNRFSEWATDVSEGFVPIVTGSFNALINVIDKVTAFFNGLGNSLHLPDWTGTALMVTGLATAFGVLLTSTITLRTGMGLLQIAQQGLRQSLVATIFNIKAEELANTKATTVLKAKILGVKSETMAQMGLSNILKAKVLGLNAESVAQKGLSGAIAETNIKRIAEANATTKQTAKNVSLLSSYVALQRQLPLTAVEGLKWHQKLALLNKETTVAQAKNMNFLQSLKSLITGLNGAKVATVAFSASIVALSAIAIGGYIISTMKSTKTMKEFNDMAENGEEKIRKIKNAMGESSEEAKNMTEAVERVRSALSKFETRKMEASDRAGRTVAKYLEDAQVDEKKIKEITNSALRDANAGVSIVARTGDEIEKTYRGASNAIGLMKGKLSKEEMEQYANDMLTSADRIAKAQEKMMMSDSAIDRAFGWFDYTVEQVGHWWTEFSTNLAHQDWSSAWENIWKGFMHGFGNLPIASDLWNAFRSAINFEGMFGEFKGSGDLLGFLKKVFSIEDLLKNNNWGNDNFIGKWLNDFFGGIEKDFNSFFDNLKLPSLGDIFGKIFGGGEGGTTGGLLAQKINPMGLLKNIFGNIDASSITDYLNNNLLTPLTDFFSSFSFDDFFANLGSFFTTGGLVGKILGLGGDTDIGAMFGEYLAIAQQYITDFITNLTTPFINLPITISTYLSQIITNITSFASQLLTNGLNAGSNFLNGVVTYISQLPGRVYSFITSTAHNIISGASQWVSNARSKAVETVNAVVTQVSQLPGKVYNEFIKIAQRIRDSISEAVRSATQFGSDVVSAVLGALHIASPGIIQEKIATEFANIPGRIAENTSNAGQQAQIFGEGIVSGFETQLPMIQQQAQAMTDAMNVSASSQAIDFSGQFVGDYQADANAITGLNQVMTTDTATTFGLMGDTVNGTINGISMNLQTQYMNMNMSQTTALTTMQNQNKTAYTNLQNQTTSSLNNMRNTTQNVTVQMTNAWNHMKDNIIASANQLKTQSTAHFNTLSNHIGTFYRKIQNPSMWGGSGDNVPTRYYNHSRGQRGVQAVKRAFGVSPTKRYAGSPTPDNLPERMTIRKLRSLVGSNSLFDNFDLDKEVNVVDFLSQFEGGFGWGDWHPTHFNKIKTTSGEWNMRSPQIMGRIDTGQNFKVKEFYNSQPNISFASFQSMAEGLFSAIPYDFYYNSDKHGSWVNALYAGSCNCYDGANAIIALASTCGFSGHMEHGTWNGIPHVYAVINGKKMDTTGWQQRRDWNGVSAGSPPNYREKKGGDKVTNVTIDMSGTTIYGIDDFEGKMEEVAQRVLGEEVNTSITLGI